MYGLDIETDTSVDGLDPAVAGVLAVAVSTPEGDDVVAGPERAVLRAVDSYLAALPPGVIVTWNGSRFDLPFIADRARRAAVKLGLRLAPAPDLVSTHPPLAGHAHAYRARWHRHVHLDLYVVHRALRQEGESGALKAVARAIGLAPVELDRTRLHELDRGVVWAYAASDARITRLLAERRWPEAAAFLDLPSAA